MHYLDETHILLFLVQIFILLLATRGLGEVLRRWNQPVLTAEILVGILLGPTILGRFLPELHGMVFPADVTQQNMLETIAWLGVLFLLLETGLEIHFSVAWRQRGNAFTIAMADIAIPMAIAFVPCLLLPDHYLVDPDRRIIFALFMATVMTISAMPVAARVLRDLNLLKADLGFLIMSALAVNDIVGWVIFTIVLGFFSQAAVSLGSVAGIFVVTIGFAALALTLGRTFSTRALDLFQRQGMPEPSTSLTFVCLLGLLFGAITQKIGIHALFGFFIAGVVMGEARNLSEQSRDVISQMVNSLFVPLFFANIGLKLDFVANFDPFLVSFMCVLGVGGRFLGAWVGVSLTRIPRINRRLIAIAHTPGGMMEVVIAVLALESGLITSPVFVAIVFSAVFSSMTMGPWMRSAMNRRASVGLMDFLTKTSILPCMVATSRREAIRELADAIADAAGVAADRVAGAAWVREEDFGTALGHGLAIPHVRLAAIKNPRVVVGRAPQGLDWNAPDGLPVTRVFFLLSPEGLNDVHVQLLAQVARVMQHPDNCRRFDQADGAAELREVLKEIFPSGSALRR